MNVKTEHIDHVYTKHTVQTLTKLSSILRVNP